MNVNLLNYYLIEHLSPGDSNAGQHVDLDLPDFTDYLSATANEVEPVLKSLQIGIAADP